MPKPFIQIFAGTDTFRLETQLDTSDSLPGTPTSNKASPFPSMATDQNLIPSPPHSHDQDALSDDEYNELVLQGPAHKSFKEYDKFQTLSLIHGAVQSPEFDLPTSFHFTKATAPDREFVKFAPHKAQAGFVTGVNKPGTGVGTHIIYNLLSIFEALTRGCDDIVLLGHSRGAVAAILAAHELNAIKVSKLQPGQDLYDLLLQTPCPYTKAALQVLSPQQKAWIKTNSNKIIDQIKGRAKTDHAEALPPATFTLFGMDPVPGKTIFHVPWFTWYDTRYFVVPPIISHAEFIIHQHERSAGFRAILPHAADPDKTMLDITPLPGHHGTGNGNFKDQKKSKVGLKTKHVQKLITAKITNLLIKHGIQFKKRHAQIFVLDDPKKLDLYRKIYKNMKDYEYFLNTSYPLIGQELIGEQKDRAICTDNIDNPKSLSSQIPHTPGYVNFEHLLLELQHTLGYPFTPLPPVGTLNVITEMLTRNAENTLASIDRAQINNPHYFDQIITSLINCIGLIFLKNHLCLQEKTQLIASIVCFLTAIKQKQNLPIFKSVYEQTFVALRDTIQTQLTMLKEQFEQLIMQPAADCLSKKAQLKQQFTLRAEYVEFFQSLSFLKKEFNQHAIKFDVLTIQQEILFSIKALCTDLNVDCDTNASLSEQDLLNLAASRGDREGMKLLLEKQIPFFDNKTTLVLSEALGYAIESDQFPVIAAYLNDIDEKDHKAFIQKSLEDKHFGCFATLMNCADPAQFCKLFLKYTPRNLSFEAFQYIWEQWIAKLGPQLYTTPLVQYLIENSPRCQRFDDETSRLRALKYIIEKLEPTASQEVQRDFIAPLYVKVFKLEHAKSSPEALLQKLSNYPERYCKTGLKSLEEALKSYDRHHVTTEPQHSPDEKLSVVKQLLITIEQGKDLPIQTFFKLREKLLNKEDRSLGILSENRQSKCEITLKIMAIITGIFGIILALKRLYDTGGKSINFFKPISDTLVRESLEQEMVLSAS